LQGLGGEQVETGRAAAHWQRSNDFSAKLLILAQASAQKDRLVTEGLMNSLMVSNKRYRSIVTPKSANRRAMHAEEEAEAVEKAGRE